MLLRLQYTHSPFQILQVVKSLPFHIPEALKRYPVRAEPPLIGHHREFPDPRSNFVLTYCQSMLDSRPI